MFVCGFVHVIIHREKRFPPQTSMPAELIKSCKFAFGGEPVIVEGADRLSYVAINVALLLSDSGQCTLLSAAVQDS